MPNKPLTVAWINDFPIEWLAEVPEPLRHLARRHPATWEMVLLAEFQKNPDLRIHVILLRSRIARDYTFEQQGAVFHVLKAPASLRLASFFYLDTWRIARLCRSIQPDLVHAWGSEKGAGLIARRLPYKSVFTIQGLLAWYKERIPLDTYDKLGEFVERRTLPSAPVVTTESKFAVKFLQERYPNMRVLQAEHAPNRAFGQVQRAAPSGVIRFICVGGISHRKGIDVLLSALAQLAKDHVSFELIFVTGPNISYFDSLKPSIPAILLERIRFLHHLPPHQVAEQLSRATMLLLPTRADTSPNAVKEAVVAGVPVVASDVGGIPDYVFPGRNGYLAPPGDLAGYSAALRQACEHPLFRQGLVDAETLVQVRDYLSPERMAKNFLAAYKAALALNTR